MANPLTSTQLAAYKNLFLWRKHFNDAVAQIFTAYGKTGGLRPGTGEQEQSRTHTAWDFQVGAATGATAPMALDFGAGTWRHPHYHEREGVLTFRVVRPMEETENLSDQITRALDTECAEIEAMFIESLVPFKSSGDFLPLYDVITIRPIEPDERPEEMREVNVAYVRFQIRFCIRQSAWPTVS